MLPTAGYVNRPRPLLWALTFQCELNFPGKGVAVVDDCLAHGLIVKTGAVKQHGHHLAGCDLSEDGLLIAA